MIFIDNTRASFEPILAVFAAVVDIEAIASVRRIFSLERYKPIVTASGVLILWHCQIDKRFAVRRQVYIGSILDAAPRFCGLVKRFEIHCYSSVGCSGMIIFPLLSIVGVTITVPFVRR